MFEIGMKIVCVDDVGQYGAPPFVVKGDIYEVTGIEYDYLGQCGISTDLKPEFLYASRFRPIVFRKTDISFAHEIPASHKELT